MANKKVFTNLQFEGNSELLNPRLNPTSTSPASKGPGQVFFDTGTHGTLMLQFAAAGATNDWRAVHTSGVPFSTNQVFTSSVATGTAPFTIASTTKVANLNVDKLNGRTWSESATGDSIVARDGLGRIKVTAPSSSDTSSSLSLYAVNKGYVDNAIQGLDHKSSVRVATIGANIDITGTATDIDHGDTFNGVTLTEGDRVLVKDQTVKAENGIYVVGAANQGVSRATDADTTGSTDISAGSDGSGFTGTGSDAILGWSASSGTPQVTSNILSWTHPSNTDWHSLNTTFTAEAGKTYVIKASFTSNTTGSWNFRATNTANQHSTTYGNIGGSFNNESVELIVTPNINGTVYVYFNSQASGAVIELSALSVLETALTDGAFVFVEEGTALANTAWVLSDASQAGNCLWTQFSGAGQISVANVTAATNPAHTTPLFKQADTINFGYNSSHFAVDTNGNLKINSGGSGTGISSALLQDDAVTAAKLDDDGDFTMGGLTVNGDTNIVGASTTRSNLKLATTSAVTDGAEVGSINGYSASQFVASIKFDKTDSNNGAIRFRQKVSGTNTNVGFISGGKLGIGADASSPSGTLHISTARYGSNLVTNGTLDGWDDSNNPTNWGIYTSGTSTVTSDTSTKYEGSASAKLTVDSSNSNVYIRTDAEIMTAGRAYKVCFYAKASSAINDIAVYAIGQNTSFYTPALTTDWAKYETTYTPTVTSALLIGRLAGANAAGKSFWIDKVEVYEDSLASTPATTADDLVINNGLSQAGLSILGSGGARIHFGESGHAAQSAIVNTYGTDKHSTLSFQVCNAGGTAATALSLDGDNNSAKFEGGVGIGALAGAGGQGLMVDKSVNDDWVAQIKNSSNTTPYGLQVLCQGSNTVTALAVYAPSNTFKVQPSHSYFSSDLALGQTTAASRLDVLDTGANVAFFRSSHATLTNVYINNTNATAGNKANLYFSPANNTAAVRLFAEAIEDFSENAKRTADFAIETRKDGTFAEAFRITSDGTQDHKSNPIVNSASIAGLQDGGACYDFDGSSSKIDIGASLLASTSGTISAWVKADSLHDSSNPWENHCIISKGNVYFSLTQDENDKFTAYTYLDTNFSAGGNTAQRILCGTTTITTGKWYHVVYTWNKSGSSNATQELYVNGVSEASKSDNTGLASMHPDGDSGTSYIGRATAASSTWDGQIREVKIFPSALEAADVRKLYSGENPKKNLNVDLVTNGDFSTSLGSEWGNGNGCQLSISSGRLVVTNGTGGSNNGYAYQEITGLTAGKTYLLEAEIIAGSHTGDYLFRFGESIYTTNGKTISNGDEGRHFFLYTIPSGDTSAFVKLQTLSNTDGVTVLYDNVTVREVGTLVDFTPQSASSSTWRNEAIPSLYHGTVNNATLSQGNSYWNNIKQDGQATTVDGSLEVQTASGGELNIDRNGNSGVAIQLKNNGDIASGTLKLAGGSGVTLFTNATEALSTAGGDVKVAAKLGVGASADASHHLLVGGTARIEYAGGAANGLQIIGSSNRSKITITDNDTTAYVIAENDYISVGGKDSLNAANLNIHKTSGNVGIGTNAAYNKLDVHFDATGENVTDGLRIQNVHGINNDFASIYFGVHGGTKKRKAAIGLKRTGSYGVGELRFAVDPNSTDTDVSFATDTQLILHQDGTHDHQGNRIVNSQTLNDSWRSSEPSLRFDGDADKVTISGSKINGTSDWTFSIWFKADYNSFGHANWGALYAHSTYNNIWIGVKKDGLTRVHAGSSSSSDTPSGTIIDNTWHHLVVTADISTNTLKQYVDGVLLDTATNLDLDNITSTDATLGQLATNGNEFAGEIKDVRIHNRALEAAEIKGLYNGESTPFVYADAIQTAKLEDARGNFEIAESTSDSDKATKWIKSASGQWEVNEGGASGGNATYTPPSGGGYSSDKLYTEVFGAADVGKRFALTFTVSANALIHVNDKIGDHDYLGNGYATYAAGTHTVYLTAVSGKTTIAFWSNNNGGTFNLSDISLVRAGEVAAYTPQSIGKSGGKWHDETTNANHGDITGATVVGKAHYGKLYVGEGGTWDTPDLDVGLTGVARLGDLYFYDSNRSIKRNGNHLEINATAASGGTDLGVIQLKGVAGVQATSADSDTLKQVARVHSQDLDGNGSSDYVITHNLGTANIVVSVRSRTCPHEHVECAIVSNGDATSTDNDPTNKCMVRFASAQASGTNYKVTVIG